MSNLNKTTKSANDVFYMTGRFQPFTLGHLALFNHMVLRAAEGSASEVYLFVSHKKPNFSRTKVPELLQTLRKAPLDMSKVKDLMKKDKSIMDNPLTTPMRVKIVIKILESIYGKQHNLSKTSGETTYKINKILGVNTMFETHNKSKSMQTLNNDVLIHIIDSEIMDTGGFKAHNFLRKRYSASKSRVRMVTGSNRKGRLPPFISATNPVYLNRNETNSGDDYYPTKLSGSKIRSWCVAFHVTRDGDLMSNIINSYYGLLNTRDVNKLFVIPISKSIFSHHLDFDNSTNSESNNNSASRNTSSRNTSSARSARSTSPISARSSSARSSSARSTSLNTVKQNSSNLRRSTRIRTKEVSAYGKRAQNIKSTLKGQLKHKKTKYGKTVKKVKSKLLLNEIDD
jgi:phosphopantetheine adenylyltransferase